MHVKSVGTSAVKPAPGFWMQVKLDPSGVTIRRGVSREPSSVREPRRNQQTSTALQMWPSFPFVCEPHPKAAVLILRVVVSLVLPGVRVGLMPRVKYAIKCLPDAPGRASFVQLSRLQLKHNVHMLVLYTAKLDFLQMERYFVSIQSKRIVCA